MDFKLYFSGFTPYYNKEAGSSTGWVTATNGQSLGTNCTIGTWYEPIYSWGARTLTINGTTYTLDSTFGNGTKVFTFKNTDINIVLSASDEPAEPTCPGSYYFSIEYSKDDTSKVVIGFDSLYHFKEKQDSFNESKFALKTNNPYVLEGNHYINKDTKKIIQRGSSSNEQLTLSSNEILLENDNYLYKANPTDGIVYVKKGSTSFHQWMNTDCFEIGDINNILQITPIALYYKNLQTNASNQLILNGSSISFKYFSNNKEFQVKVPNEVNGTLGLAMYRHQVELEIDGDRFLYVFYSTRTEACNSIADLTAAIQPNSDFKEHIFSLQNILGLLSYNAKTNKWIITINDHDVEILNVNGMCQKV